MMDSVVYERWMDTARERLGDLFSITFDLYAKGYIKERGVQESEHEGGLKEALVVLLMNWQKWGGGFVWKYEQAYWIAVPETLSVAHKIFDRSRILFDIEGPLDYKAKFGTIGGGGTYEDMADQIIGHLFS
jgi:hypothetical protein